MFVPEYTITTEILKNIAQIEYGRALVENTTILSHWEKQIQKEAVIKTAQNLLFLENFSHSEDVIKKEFDGLGRKSPKEVKNFVATVKEISNQTEIDEKDENELKNLHKNLGGAETYRSSKLENSVDPQSILAEVVSLFDWAESLDSKETHPVIVAGILHAQIERIKPFGTFDLSVATLIGQAHLNLSGYFFKGFLSFAEFFYKNRKMYEKSHNSVFSEDLTEWLEFYTGAISRESAILKEKMLLLARDTKIAKASGRIELTDRQERIIEYLQDYGVLQNKDFAEVFPDVSEDSILRDLKILVDKGIVRKSGKTKSSRYEL